MSFKTSILEIAPRWLVGKNAGAMLRTFGTMFDSLNSQLRAGVKARLPEYAPDDALKFIGNDRSFEQGPNESNNNFRARLVGAVDANKRRGNAGELLNQLAGYFAGGTQPPLSLVSNSGVWHEYDWATGLTRKSIVGNWDWDGHPERWWRGWVIIDGSSLGLSTWKLGDGTPFDGSRVLGSTASVQTVQAIQRIVQKWKPANVHVVRIIVMFTPGVFGLANPSSGVAGPWVGPEYNFLLPQQANPGGEYADPTNWNPSATYWLGGGEES